MRTKVQIHTLCGHTNTVSSILTNSVDPQIITGSNDATVKVSTLSGLFCVESSLFAVVGLIGWKVHVNSNSTQEICSRPVR